MRVQLIAKPTANMTGISRYMTGLYRGLQNIRIDVDIKAIGSVPLPRLLQNGLQRLGIDLQSFWASYPLALPSMDADVCHLTAQTMATALLFRRPSTPIVVTVHDLIPFLLRHDARLNTLRHGPDAMCYRLALHGLRQAHTLVAVSHYTKQTLIDLLGIPSERIHVVYEPVDHQLFRPMSAVPNELANYGLGMHERVVLYVGSDDPRKRLDTFITAFATVSRACPSAKLLLVGSAQFPGERHRLFGLRSELQLESSVCFLDRVPDHELALLYNRADVVVMPSELEGFGLPALEAMACARPVVASRAGALPEIIQEGGLLVAPGDADELAQAVLRFLNDQELARTIGAAGLQRAAAFTYERQARETLAVYAQAIAAHQTSSSRSSAKHEVYHTASPSFPSEQ